MIIKLDVSKLERITITKIAGETDDVSALERLAQIDDANVIKAVIQNPATTKEIRELIYRNWKNKGSNMWIMRALVDCPLNNITISSMVESIIKNELCTDTMTCVKLAEQEDISNEELNKLYDYVTCGYKEEEILRTMARREDLSEELANKLLKCSPDIASIVAETYMGFLKVDFSLGQTE